MTIEAQIAEMPAGSDIFASTCEALVDPVDCTGAQGKGLAKQFRKRYPAACAAYKWMCRSGYTEPGDVWGILEMQSIVFMATKDHWRDRSRLPWIRLGLEDLFRWVSTWGIRSIAIPALGCGEGGLEWNDVRPLILQAAERMAEIGVLVEIYPPHDLSKK